MSSSDRPPNWQQGPQTYSGVSRNAPGASIGSRARRIVFSFVTLLMGIILGVAVTLLYALSISGNRPVVVAPSTGVGDIVVQTNRTFLAHLIEENLRTSGMPGDITNVQVQLVHGAQLTITGDDGFSVLGVGVTRPFTLVVEPYVDACEPQIHVIHADLSDIPVTGLVSAFEGKINQQLRSKPSGLPTGFTYCTVGVRTEPQGLFVTYAATPLSK